MAVNETLEITWYGQSMFTFAGGGITVACDPTAPETGYDYRPVAADVVLMSHNHFDHSYLPGVRDNPSVLSASGTFELERFTVRGYDSFHDSSGGKERGPNIIFVWEQAGLTLAHLGDLGDTPARDVLKRLVGLDIVMVPVGGLFTIDGEQAARLVGDLAPKVALPMHYGTAACKIPLEPVEGFTGKARLPVRESADRPLAVSRDSLPGSSEIWIVPYQ